MYVVSLLNDVAKNFREIKLLHNNNPMEQNLVYIKGAFINNGDIDIKSVTTENSIIMSLPDDYNWVDLTISSHSENLACTTSTLSDNKKKIKFESGEDQKHGSLIINDRYKTLAKKVKELIDSKSSFADWLTNGNVRADLNQELFFLLAANGYTPEWSDDVFNQVLDQVENFKENSNGHPRSYVFPYSNTTSIAAEP